MANTQRKEKDSGLKDLLVDLLNGGGEGDSGRQGLEESSTDNESHKKEKKSVKPKKRRQFKAGDSG